LRTFDSKLLLTLRNMNFENVLLTKAWMHYIHDIKSICSLNVYISKMQC
jgi:hypothetical protein